MLAPRRLEQDRRVGLELARADTAQQHLLVERDDEIGVIATVRDRAGPNANADSGGPGDAARRRLDLGRDNLDRPDAVAAAGGDRAQRLAAALRTLARVADHLDDVLGQDLGALRAGQAGSDGAFDDCGVAHHVTFS